MPAIQPARLKQQVTLLAQHFANPPALVRNLHHLLDFYADRAHRPGQTGKPAPLIKAYRVHPPVLRQILQELTPLVVAEPQKGLMLCDALWEQPYLEFRLLSAMLLGQLPPSLWEQVTQNLQSWLTTDLEDDLILALLLHGLTRTRRENPQAIISLAGTWLAASDTFYQQLGLRILLPLIMDSDFENLPAFFRLVHPLIRVAPTTIRPDILDVVGALARRSPQETAYFLRQTLTFPDCPDTPWLIRQSLDGFPPELQDYLRKALRATEQQADGG